MPRSIRILLTGAGSPAAPGIIKSLRLSRDFRSWIYGVDCRREAPGLHLADDGAVGPMARDPSFLPFIAARCAEQRIDLLLSLVTAELVPLATARARLTRAGTRLLTSSPERIRDVIQKDRLYRLMREQGLPVPEYRAAGSVEELLTAIDALGYPERAICFKPAVGDGGRGFHIVDARADRFRQLVEEKPDSAHISHAELLRILQEPSDRPFPIMLAMEYLPGEEYSIDLLADHGRTLVAVPRLRQRTTGGITTQGVIRDAPDVTGCAERIVRALGLHGNVGIQLRRDADGSPKLIEINPRMQGTIVHATAAGVNLPALAVKLALGMPIRMAELKIRWNIGMTRYWEEVYRDGDGSAFTL